MDEKRLPIPGHHPAAPSGPSAGLAQRLSEPDLRRVFAAYDVLLRAALRVRARRELEREVGGEGGDGDRGGHEPPAKAGS